MGAILDGNMIGCSGTVQGDTFSGSPFTTSMWVYLPEVTTEQYLYCDLMIHADNTVSERFCLSVLGGNLYATINDGLTSADKFGVSGVPAPVAITGAAVAPGWNLISAYVNYSGTATQVTAQIYSEATNTKITSTATDIATDAYVDSSDFIACVGGSL